MAAVDNSMGALCTAWHNSWYASLVPAALDVWIFFWKFGIRRHVTFLERYPSFASRDAGNFPRGGNDLDIQKLADTAPQGKAGCELVGGIRVETVHSVWPDPLAAQYSKSSWAARRSGTAQLLSNWALWDGVTCRSWATLHDNLTVFSVSRLERDTLWG